MIEETIQKLTASIDALTATLSKLTAEPSCAVAGPAPVAEAAPAPAVEPKPETPKKAKKPTLVEAPLDPAPAPVVPPVLVEPKYPEQAAVIDTAGQLLTATNQNDGGFLRNLAKELGLDKLRNAKPEQRQAIIDRITTEIARVKESAV